MLAMLATIFNSDRLQNEIFEHIGNSVTSVTASVIDAQIENLTYRLLYSLPEKVNAVINCDGVQLDDKENVFIKFERFVVEKQDILKNCSSLLDSKVNNLGTILEPKFRVYDLCSIVDQTPKDLSLKVDRLLQSSDLSQQESEVQGSLFKFPKFPFAQEGQYVLFKSNTSELFNQTTAKNYVFRPDIIQLTGSSRSLDTFSNNQQQEDNVMLLTPNQKSRSLEIYPCCKKLVCMTIVGSMKWDKNKKGRERLVFLPRHLLFRKKHVK